MNGGKVESFNGIKDGNGRLAMDEDKVERNWKDYFKDLYNIETQEQLAVHMCGFNGVQRGSLLIRRTKVEVRLRNLLNVKTEGKDEVTGEMIKGGGDLVVGWI